MEHVATDTHTLVWYLTDDSRLGPLAGEELDRCVETGTAVFVPAMVLVEMLFLGERGKIVPSLLEEFLEELQAGESVFKVVPLDLGVIGTLRQIRREAIPELPDRVIAATALHLGVPLLTRDHRIQGSGLRTLW